MDPMGDVKHREDAWNYGFRLYGLLSITRGFWCIVFECGAGDFLVTKRWYCNILLALGMNSNLREVIALTILQGSPRGAYNSASQPWYSNFYTAATSFDVGAAMNNPGGSDYALIVRDIDAIAVQLKRLQAAGVPVLWRPLHEAEGGWFWWGAKGADPCKKLWALLYDRLTNYHKLNNLIWVWNSVNSGWYPGNGAVDIVSADIYASAGDHQAQTSTFNSLKSLCGDSKIIAMTECGNIPNFSTSAPWAWWVVWGGSFINGGSYNSKSFLQTTYGASNVLTLDELGNWKSGSGGVTTTTIRTTTRTTAGTQPTSGSGSPLVSLRVPLQRQVKCCGTDS
jgi:mannan endo-1,4-beta-mannosidase